MDENMISIQFMDPRILLPFCLQAILRYFQKKSIGFKSHRTWGNSKGLRKPWEESHAICSQSPFHFSASFLRRPCDCRDHRRRLHRHSQSSSRNDGALYCSCTTTTGVAANSATNAPVPRPFHSPPDADLLGFYAHARRSLRCAVT
jgi:hypothetical protein